MDKLAVGPDVDPSVVSLDKSVAENLNAVAAQLRKPVGWVSLCARVWRHTCRWLIYVCIGVCAPVPDQGQVGLWCPCV